LNEIVLLPHQRIIRIIAKTEIADGSIAAADSDGSFLDPVDDELEGSTSHWLNSTISVIPQNDFELYDWVMHIFFNWVHPSNTDWEDFPGSLLPKYITLVKLAHS